MDLTVMHINKGNAHGTQGERSNPANSNEYLLLTENHKCYWSNNVGCINVEMPLSGIVRCVGLPLVVFMSKLYC